MDENTENTATPPPTPQPSAAPQPQSAAGSNPPEVTPTMTTDQPGQPGQAPGTDSTQVDAPTTALPGTSATAPTTALPHPAAASAPTTAPPQPDPAAYATAGAYGQAPYGQPSGYAQGAPAQGAYPQGGYGQGAYAQGAYPPPAATPPGAAYPPAGASYPPGYAAPGSYPPIRRLVRSRSDRYFGGVCGGLARYWNTDPVLIRILAVVLTLATGGALLLGYLIAWIAIPDEPMGPAAPFGTAPAAEPLGYAAGGNPPYADYAAAYVPPAPRERSHLGWLTLSIGILVAGVLGLLAVMFDWGVTAWGVTLGILLAILGLGLLVGTRYGRARWLVWLAVPLAFITMATVSAGNWASDNSDLFGSNGGVGDRTWVVTTDQVGGPPLDFQLGAGEAVLDLTALTQVDATEPGDSGQRVEIDANVGLGQLVVLIPEDMTLDLSSTVRPRRDRHPRARPGQRHQPDAADHHARPDREPPGLHRDPGRRDRRRKPGGAP